MLALRLIALAVLAGALAAPATAAAPATLPEGTTVREFDGVWWYALPGMDTFPSVGGLRRRVVVAPCPAEGTSYQTPPEETEYGPRRTPPCEPGEPTPRPLLVAERPDLTRQEVYAVLKQSGRPKIGHRRVGKERVGGGWRALRIRPGDPITLTGLTCLDVLLPPHGGCDGTAELRSASPQPIPGTRRRAILRLGSEPFGAPRPGATGGEQENMACCTFRLNRAARAVLRRKGRLGLRVVVRPVFRFMQEDGAAETITFAVFRKR